MLRLLVRLPAHVLNGIAVALGIGCVQLAVAPFGATAVQIASSAAICASLPHLADRAGRTGRRVLAGGMLAVLAATTLALLRAFLRAPPFVVSATISLTIGLIVFAATMALGWGKRAGPLAFATLLAIVFSLSAPGGRPLLAIAGWSTAGVLVYAGWAVASTRVLEARYRTLAVATALRATARLLRSRAETMRVASPSPLPSPWMWIRAEAALAESLQNARDLVFPAADGGEARRETAILLATIELRDLLLASRLDLELLGDDALALGVRRALAEALESTARAVDEAGRAVRGRRRPDPAMRTPLADVRRPFRALVVGEIDPRRRIIPVIEARFGYIAGDVERIHAAIAGQELPLALTREELARFVADDRWPFAVIRSHLALDSPTLRHAIRTALAVGSVHAIAYALPWAPHPYWLILTVAVVLRGTLDQTLARRNQRVIGTAVGCFVVAMLLHVLPAAALRVVVLAATGTAHAFVNVRYVLTAGSATVMALVQAHLATSTSPFVLAERLGDTVAGALIAWAFGYVLPSWERRTLPGAIRRALDELRGYAACALVAEGDPARDAVEQRLARQRAYDALEALGSAMQRSEVEPRSVRPPPQIIELVDGAQRLMAHLSATRLLLVRRSAMLAGPEVKHALDDARALLDDFLREAEPTRALPPFPMELPAEPPSADARPWLVRRLAVTVYRGARVGGAARTALASLGETVDRARHGAR